MALSLVDAAIIAGFILCIGAALFLAFEFNSETPDAYGWSGWGGATLGEWPASYEAQARAAIRDASLRNIGRVRP